LVYGSEKVNEGKRKGRQIMPRLFTLTRLASALVVVVVAAQLQADSIIISDLTGGGPGASAQTVFIGTSTFTNPPLINAALSNEITTKTFTDTSQMSFNATYDYFDVSNILRWTERVTNNSGVAWTGYTLTLNTQGDFFNDLPVFSPGMVSINGGGPISPVTNSIVRIDSGYTVTSENSGQTLVFAFDSPVPSGSFFDIHVPIENLSAATGTFSLSETPVVPEPSRLVGLFGLAGVGLVGLVWRRRK
jgi:hypothetical protein